MTLFCCSISSSPEASMETARPSLAVFWGNRQLVGNSLNKLLR